MNKKYLGLGLGIFFFKALPAKAVCPVCVVAVGAGLGLSRYLGIDDTITGLWIGALTVSMIAWTINWFKPKLKNQKNLPWWSLLTVTTYYAMIFWPLINKDLIGHPLNTLFGVDKVVLGLVTGSITFAAVSKWYLIMKKNNNNHAYFPFQKVVMPVVALGILSLLFYLLTK